MFENSSKEYDKFIITFSIRNQLRYRGNLGEKVKLVVLLCSADFISVRHLLKDEKRYYERVIAYSRERLMLFPYHLADMIVKGLRITPFNYYISVVEKLMQAEKSYDTLPNFTAADCKLNAQICYAFLLNKIRNENLLLAQKHVIHYVCI